VKNRNIQKGIISQKERINMEEIILNAMDRAIEPGKFKETGFIAGVLYGDGIAEAVSVKFQEASLKKIIAKHGTHAKVWITYGEDKKFGFLKEVQRHPVTWTVTHIDVQIVSKTHEIKMQLPINFKGEDHLIIKQLRLQIFKSEIDVLGRMDIMPDSIDTDISAKELGDTITIKDFNLDKQIKVSDKEDEIYGTIMHMRAVEEEVKEEANEETEVKAEA